MKLLIINGPNLNLLGRREPQIYGTRDYASLVEYLQAACARRGAECEVYQSNHEGDIVDKIQSAMDSADGIIINPAAYTHTSIAIPDALRAVSLPAVEVHLSDISGRESYRRISYTSEACLATCKGKGFDSYGEAVDLLADRLEK